MKYCELKTLVLFFLSLFILGCSKKDNEVTSRSNCLKIDSIKQTSKYEFVADSFVIQKGRIGPIRIGGSLKDFNLNIANLKSTEKEAIYFGYDGGGYAKIYKLGHDTLFVVIPERDSDKILAIQAFSKKLKTSNGLTPKSSLDEVKYIYSDFKLEHNLMNDWDYFHDKENKWNLVTYDSRKSNLEFIEIK